MSGDWQDVAGVDEVEPGGFEVLETDDIVVAVFNVDGQFFAIEDVCTHDGAELAGGPVDGDQVICPRHGARFCLRTGQREEDGLHLTHAALSENQQPAGQTMYLREEVVVFATIPDGVGVYRITFTRAQDIGPAAKVLLERTARTTQGRLYRALEEWL